MKEKQQKGYFLPPLDDKALQNNCRDLPAAFSASRRQVRGCWEEKQSLARMLHSISQSRENGIAARKPALPASHPGFLDLFFLRKCVRCFSTLKKVHSTNTLLHFLLCLQRLSSERSPFFDNIKCFDNMKLFSFSDNIKFSLLPTKECHLPSSFTRTKSLATAVTDLQIP